MYQGDAHKISLPLQESNEQWQISHEEGKLSVDVAETADALFIAAPMAGTPPANIELHLHNDLLTVRGERPSPIPPDAHYFHNE